MQVALLSVSLKERVRSWLSRPFSYEADRPVVWATMGLFVVLWCAHMWLAEDAMLTFRQVLNFAEGYGMVWNVGERVQAFTHPVWFLLLSVAHVLSGGLLNSNLLKFSSSLLSLCLSLAACLIFLKSLRGLNFNIVTLLLLALFSSQAFIDYTSSGLENSLSYFLVALIAYRFFSDRYDGFFFLLCALLFLNRMDYALLLLPLCLYAWRSCGYKISVVFPAVSLCLLWLIFSTWYFGHPLPNTFLAKLSNDASFATILNAGLRYHKFTFFLDPVTFFVIFLAIGMMFANLFFHRNTKFFGAGLGLLFYNLYIVKIGGDYMLGRFFAVPFFFALCVVCFWLKEKKFLMNLSLRSLRYKIFVSVIFFLVALSSFVSISQRIKFSLWASLLTEFVSPQERVKPYLGVDHRRFFGLTFQFSSRYNYQSFSGLHPQKIVSHCCPPALGIHSLGEIYILDTYALTSPYLSRLSGHWRRAGHVIRIIPTDLEAFLMRSSQTLDDNDLTIFFSDIRDITRGDLFSWNRTKKIAKIHFYNYKVDLSSTRNRNQPRFSRLYPSLQQKASFLELPSVDIKAWNNEPRKRWHGYNITQSISIALKREKINKISFPAEDITEYTWSLYDGQKKIYEDAYKTDKKYSIHTSTLPKVIQADRLEFVVKKGGAHRRIARPIIE